jgi:3',5'-cyclic AMP phosphodiesterase CpdA
MLLLHLSDLHLSRYGESGLWSQPNDEGNWERIHIWQRWMIEGIRDKKGRPEKLRLIDPEGVMHASKGWPKRDDDKVIGQLLATAMERHQTSSEQLVVQRPTGADLSAMLRVDPTNTNLLFLDILDRLLPLDPDLIVVTGDITDNGFGYELIEHYLRPWIEQQRLMVIPGNHDTYDMLPRRGRKDRAALKEQRYLEFAKVVGTEPNRTGAWVKRIYDLAIVGLSSCKPPRTPLSATGEVTDDQLVWLKELSRDPAFAQARLRIGLVHHHVLQMPVNFGKRSPIEVGLRLRNADEVMKSCVEAGLDMLFHGHRHYGYLIHLPGYPMVISSPSSTLGCRYSGRRYAWTIDLGRQHPYPVAQDYERLAPA